MPLRSFEQDFLIEYTHNSTAIEGNTLTLLQTKVVLEDGISVGGKTLREIYEVVNHGKAFAYVQKCISEGPAVDRKYRQGCSRAAHGEHSGRRDLPQR